MNETIFTLKALKSRILNEAENITDVLDLIDDEIWSAQTWEEIDKMSPEEVRTYLLANGYTEESLKAGLDKLLKMINDEMAKREEKKNT